MIDRLPLVSHKYEMSLAISPAVTRIPLEGEDADEGGHSSNSSPSYITMDIIVDQNPPFHILLL